MPEASLLDLLPDELRERLDDLPPYRATQILQAVYRDLVTAYDAITTLPLALRARLTDGLPFPIAEPIDERVSPDRRTRKTLFRLGDGETIEAVTMEFVDRRTACVSSQVGCPIGCPFCATGQGGFVRDLTAGEMVSQVLHAARQVRAIGGLSHVVYMGMGEPMLNFGAVLRSIRILNDPESLSLGARSFTISTAGVVPGIDRLADEDLQVNLAVSLHAADDALRDRLVPINRRYPIRQLLNACRRYVERTRRRITFEFALIDGVNDGTDQARAVARLLGGLLCHVNLIPYNPTDGSTSRRSPRGRVEAFAEVLADAGIPVTVRKRMGIEIEAGCGQLRAREPSRDTRSSGGERAPSSNDGFG